MSERKIYIEAYGGLFEVIDPTWDDDGTIHSSKYREITSGDGTWIEHPGSFRYGVVYDNLLNGVGADTEGCDLPGCCGNTEDCAQQPEQTPPQCQMCANAGPGAQCSDCPFGPVEVVEFDALALGAIVGVGVLSEIATGDAPVHQRATAAGALIDAFLRANER
jgi:hypothetical protein